MIVAKRIILVLSVLIAILIIAFEVFFYSVAGFVGVLCVSFVGVCVLFLISKIAFDVSINNDIILFDTLIGSVEMKIDRIKVGAGCVPFGFMILATPGYIDGGLYTVGYGWFKAVWIDRKTIDKEIFMALMSASNSAHVN